MLAPSAYSAKVETGFAIGIRARNQRGAFSCGKPVPTLPENAHGDFEKTLMSTVEPRRFIRSGFAASAIAHLSVLTMVLFFAEVHPFGSVTAEPITVDIVSPAEAAPTPKKEEEPVVPKPQPSDAFDLSSKAAASGSPAPQPAAAQPQKQAALSTPRLARPAAAVQPQPPSASPTPSYIAPEPDLSIKYHVMLGLPPELPPGPPQDRPGDGVDALASDKAEISSSLVTEFRRHLKTCSKLPASIAPSDNVRIKLRVFMTPDGKIAAEPIVVEGSATLKGLDLRQSAIDALVACQPYAMLPVDRYGEWKVLDLSFTPQDFSGGS
jgi:hypothetical protein